MNISLSLEGLKAITPLLILLGGGLIVLMLESFADKLSKTYSALITLATIALAFIVLLATKPTQDPLLTPWLRFDPLARFFTVFFLGIGFGTTLLSSAFFKRFEASHGEYYFLLICSLIGLILIGDSADFLTLFLGLEILSISLYVLCGYMRKWEVSHEAALKYFFTGAIATAIFIYGIALIYGSIGTLKFNALLEGYQSTAATSSNKFLFLAGIAMVTAGLAFKAAIVPLHVWAPDVYDGAPTPVTAYMSIGTKVGAFAAFAIIFLVFLRGFDTLWNQGISILSYMTMIYANFVALRQKQLRRFFAYSGISHSGFLLIPLAAGTPEALPALLFYLIIYAFATLGSFAVLAFLDRRPEGIMMHDLAGLFYQSPWAAGALTLCFLTLAGIPPTAGFLAKFYVFKVGFEAGYYGLVVVGLLTTILSAFYYLRFVGIMFSAQTGEMQSNKNLWPATAVGAFSIAAIVFLSIYPEPILALTSLFATSQ